MLIKGVCAGIFFAVLGLVAPVALADQAQAIPPSYALHAKALLSGAVAIKEFCAPCGDRRAVSIPARNVVVVDSGIPGFSSVEVDGRDLDLAYTYFFSGGQWLNLAIAVGYTVSGVPRTIGDDLARAATATLMEAQPGYPGSVHFSDSYKVCVERAGNEAETLLGCIKGETDEQETLLNTAYEQVMSALPPDRQVDLRTAERLWIQYRTANCGFYLYRAGGTSALVTSSVCNLRMTAERAEELEDMGRMYR